MVRYGRAKGNQKKGVHQILAKKESFLKMLTSVDYIRGVGPKVGQLLKNRGLLLVRDVLSYYPRAYEDRHSGLTLSQIQPEQLVSLKVTIVGVKSLSLRGGRSLSIIQVQDSTGSVVCRFFRLPYKGYLQRFYPQKEVRLIGKAQWYKGCLEFHHPELRDLLEKEEERYENSVIPVYSEIEFLTSSKIHKIIVTVLSDMPPEQWEDPLPSWVRKQYQLLSKKEALLQVHQPQPGMGALLEKFHTEGQKRLIFEEFFWLELKVLSRLKGNQSQKSASMSVDSHFLDELKPLLPFDLTEDQKKVLKDIFQDLSKSYPMSRLIQGDVGSGKTVVAFIAALVVMKEGYQVALMAPTEVLAQQHYEKALEFFQRFSFKVSVLVGSTSTSSRQKILEELSQGEISLLIGTHALIEDRVIFSSLSLVIIDEQHRFGVKQRGRLRVKGVNPHVLLMTATPIPRTLALTTYGDLDVSSIHELPKGRLPILTRVTQEAKRPQVYGFIQDHLTQGRQVYIIYPLVEESEKMDLKSATQGYETIQNFFQGYRVGLLHGQMKAQEKEILMTEFRHQRVDILVSTTVVEVGVDVPNASIMLIEQAERFGLSQLHQLRGRVGRGPHKSYCILMPGPSVSESGRYRLSVMEKTTSGFAIAQADLELRGPGELLGLKQSGEKGFRLADLVRDEEVLLQARQGAWQILEQENLLTVREKEIIKEFLASPEM
jgi:ATP-dependent DNA helicase RecG